MDIAYNNRPQSPRPARNLRQRTRGRLIRRILLLIALFWAVMGFDPRLQVTRYSYTSERLPASFDGYRVAIVSDLHCKAFGKKQSDLLRAIERQKPDILVLTGDVVDEDHEDIGSVSDLLRGLNRMIPIYYVSGNHDRMPEASNQYAQMLDLFQKYGVVNLDGKRVALRAGSDVIYLCGLKYHSNYIRPYLHPADGVTFNILLYHGSDSFSIIKNFGYNLVLSGHSHGGLIRLPFIGGLIGNDGKLFPQYAGGVFTENGSTLISSRGLGDAFLPRFYNRPQIVIVTLRSRTA